MEQLKEVIAQYVCLNGDDWRLLMDSFETQRIGRKTILVSENQTAKYLYFVSGGLLRAYHLEDGEEINTYFACDSQFITCYASFISQSPSFEYLEAMEDSLVHRVSYETLYALYEQSSQLEKIGRILAEKNYLCVIDRIYKMQTKNARERYLDFLISHEKKIVQRVPLHHIASYLGIAPQSLSRIRKEVPFS